jgi:hypothetical protein
MKKKQYNEPLVEVMRVRMQDMMVIDAGTTGAVPPGPGLPGGAPRKQWTEVF